MVEVVIMVQKVQVIHILQILVGVFLFKLKQKVILLDKEEAHKDVIMMIIILNIKKNGKRKRKEEF
jgi:hypothetical protein